jgi:hypothetical protein
VASLGQVLVTEVVMAGMTFTDKSVMPFVGPFPSAMGALSYRGRAMVVLTPFFDPCCVSLWPERGFNGLVWESPALGLEAPSL